VTDLTRRQLSTLLLFCLPVANAFAQQNSDPLPSWRDGATKRAILDFIRDATTAGAADYIAPADRLAVFDNDGTLWPEKPIYTEVAFAMEHLRALAQDHPELTNNQSLRAALAGDVPAVALSGLRGMGEVVMAAESNTTPEMLHESVAAWIKTARHPRFARRYSECVYEPMQEVLALFRSAGFVTCIVSGGTEEFLRSWAEAAYGVPADRVIGSTLKLHYQNNNGKGELIQVAQLDRLNEGAAKPAAVLERLGRRPVAAFGNSDGDCEMLQYTTTGQGRRLGVLIHHDDADREYAYDRQSDMGRLDRGLTDAQTNGWVIASMKNDWSRIFRDA
jgi:phosphoglycolate phosphatase-like HAD superfamily hydrolase